MKDHVDISDSEINALYEKINKDAGTGGYHLNPDMSFTLPLIRGLALNRARYGYMACPCRLASGERQSDADIICPCDYRDPDLDQYGACYCALYVSQDILDGTKKLKPLPDRREREKAKKSTVSPAPAAGNLSYPVWRCRVCGYLCAREEPPAQCPVCKVSKERFELFMK